MLHPILETVAETAAEAITETAAETLPVAGEIQADIQKLQPGIIKETLDAWGPELLRLGYRILLAAVIIIIGIQTAKLTRRVLAKTFKRMGLEAEISQFLTSIANIAVYMLAILIAAERLGIPSSSILAILGLAGLAIVLALQGSLSNFSGSIMILIMRPFVIGDYIICSAVEGTVKNIGFMYTTLLTGDNRSVTIPNGELSNSTVTNVTREDKRRLDLTVRISYDSDLKKAKMILEEILTAQEPVLKDQPILVFVSELAESAVILGGRVWTATGDYWTVRWAVTEQVKVRFEQEGIEIPFARMDVHLEK